VGLSLFIRYHENLKNTEWCRFHHLKLYPEDESGPQTTKKPVVMESYDEIVFSEPSEALYARISNHPAVVLSGLPSSIPAPSGLLPIFSWIWHKSAFIYRCCSCRRELCCNEPCFQTMWSLWFPPLSLKLVLALWEAIFCLHF